MAHSSVELRDIIRAHYGKALKQADRNESGGHSVYGSSGAVGKHDDALTTEPTLVVGRKGSVGEVIIAPSGGWVIDTAYYVERLNSDSVDLRYLYYAMKRANLGQKAITTSIPGLNRDDLYDTKIPLPPLKEQKRIAAILDKADAIRRKRQQAIQLADQFLRAVFLDMFGDPVTNPKRLNEKRIDSFCEIVRGSSPRPKGDPRYYGGPVPRLMVQDLTRDGWLVTPRIDTLTIEGAKKSRPIEAGTVVMAVSGNVGLTSILAVDACIHDGFIAFNKLDKTEVFPEFLLFTMTFLKSTHSAREAGAIFKNLTTHQIKEMLIPIPGIPEQNQFVSAYRKQMEIVSQLENATRNADELFNSLSSGAFAGEL